MRWKGYKPSPPGSWWAGDGTLGLWLDKLVGIPVTSLTCCDLKLIFRDSILSSLKAKFENKYLDKKKFYLSPKYQNFQKSKYFVHSRVLYKCALWPLHKELGIMSTAF